MTLKRQGGREVSQSLITNPPIGKYPACESIHSAALRPCVIVLQEAERAIDPLLLPGAVPPPATNCKFSKS